MSIKADQALEIALTLPGASVLDVGCGDQSHARLFKSAGFDVKTISMVEPADFIGAYESIDVEQRFKIIWCSHCLEHTQNPGLFLSKCYSDLKYGGWLCVTVPPLKHNIVGGHVTLWNEGTLLYNLILAGFDCSKAKVKKYGYNISVIVQKTLSPDLSGLVMDNGDIATLAKYFPVEVSQNSIIEGPINWTKEN